MAETAQALAAFPDPPAIRFVRCPESGRGAQMNHGAQQAAGDYLVFLHADTRLPKDAVAIVRRVLADSAVALAGFRTIFSGQDRCAWQLRLLEPVQP